METILEQTSGSLRENPSNGLLVPPIHAIPRSKTGRKPQRSSPLAGPAVLVSDADNSDTSSRSVISYSRHDSNSLSPRPTLRPRPKSMVSDYSTFSMHTQSLTPRSRPHAIGTTKQIIRPISSVLPFSSAAQEHLDSSTSSSQTTVGEDFRNLGEQRHQPLTGSNTNNHVSPTTSRLSVPTISLNDNEISVNVDIPQIPPPARSTSRTTAGTTPRDNSWYIASAYDDTPRFSRLGLFGDNVVLPVSTKEFKKCQHQRLRHPDRKSSRSSLMGCTMASTLKLARSISTKTLTDPQSTQEPTSPSTSSSLSSHASSTATFPDSDSSPATSPASSSSFKLSPHPTLSRTRTSSFTYSSASSYTFFTPDIVTSSSWTSVNEEPTHQPSSSPIAHRKDRQQEGKPLSVSGKDRSKKVLIKRRTTIAGASGQLRFNPEKMSIEGVSCPVVDIEDEKKHMLRRGGSFRRFISRLFVSS